MAETTIEWTRGPNGEQGYTFNPWIGCEKISPACDNCYAAAQDKFRHWTAEGWGGPRRRTAPANWAKPKQWDAAAKAAGTRYRVFCASLADVFDNQVPEDWRDDLFGLIAATPNLDWLLLTKRIGNAKGMLPATWAIGATAPWPNVWLGATVANQEEADRDIPKLLATPARVRFLSMEPLLGPVDLSRWIHRTAGYSEQDEVYRCRGCGITGWGQYFSVATGGDDWECRCQRCGASAEEGEVDVLGNIDWAITGAESGALARPSHPDWFRAIRNQCEESGTAYLHKQNGEWVDFGHMPDGWWNSRTDEQRRSTPQRFVNGTALVRVGKKAAGRLLDGRTWDGFPK